MSCIDLHGHHGPINSFPMFRGTSGGLLREMDRHGVETLVLSPHKALMLPGTNEETLPVLLEGGSRFRAYWVVHPHATEPARERERLDALLSRGFVGLKFHSSLHGYPLDGPLTEPWWDYANARRLLVLAHTWGGDGRCGFANCKAICEKYPQVRFILGHSGYHEHERFAALARDFEHVYLDTCAVGCLNGSIETMVRVAGASKLVFGTDLPWFDPGYLIGCVRHSRISEADKSRILHDNAARILQDV